MKSIYTKTFSFILLLLLFISCVNKNNTIQTGENFGGKLVPMKYAHGFKIYEKGEMRRIVILNPTDTSQVMGDFVISKSKTHADASKNIVHAPLQRFICLSSTQLAYFIALDATDNIVGINSSEYLFNKKLKKRIKEGIVKRLGKEGNFDVEKIAGLNPEVVFVSPIKAGGYDAIKSLGLQLVPITAYDETTPLARAEWIKLIAVFTGKEAQAEEMFKEIETEYLKLKALATSVKSRPTVFSGKMKDNSWYLPGGASFYSNYFRDAGADYINKDGDIGGVTVDFETIYKKAAHSDFWRLRTSSENGYNSKMLVAENSRYGYFDAFKKHKILLVNIRETPYDEINPVCPHIMLADYISFFHPELLPHHKRVFYRGIDETPLEESEITDFFHPKK